MQLPKPRAIIFDWDNTLVNTWPIIHEALVETFREMGREPWSFDQTVARVRKSMRDSFPEVFGENWQQASERYQFHYRSKHLEQLDPLPGALQILQKVRALGLYSTVVSNKKGVNLRQEVTHLGWREYFDSIVGANDAAHDKPHSDPVHLAFENTQITPGSDVWFIGDSEIDMECAEATGCTGILFGELAAQHADYTQTHYQGFPYHAHAIDHQQLLALL